MGKTWRKEERERNKKEMVIDMEEENRKEMNNKEPCLVCGTPMSNTYRECPNCRTAVCTRCGD